MEKNWVKVYSTTDAVKAEIVKDMLESNDVPAVLINKKEKLSGGLLGEAEVYTNSEDAETALSLIKASADA